MSRLFISGGQGTGASASTSVLPVNIQGWFPLGLNGLSQESSPAPQLESINSLVLAFFILQFSYLYMTTGKTSSCFDYQTFVGKVMSLLFNMLSRLVITFLLRRKGLLISWLQSLSAVILEPKKVKSVTAYPFPFYLTWHDGTRCHDLRFLNVEL